MRTMRVQPGAHAVLMEQEAQSIPPASTKARPEVLHKYMPLIGCKYFRRVATILRRSTIHFSSSAAFNDPFDCRIKIDFDGTDEDLGAAVVRILKANGIPLLSDEEPGERVAQLRTEKGRDLFLQTVREGAKRIGVLCLVEDPSDLLMWAHYGASHAGVCLAFDTTCSPFSTARAVAYSRDYLSIRFTDSDGEQMARDSLFTKAEEWIYENEWRSIDDEQGPGPHSFPREALVGVVRGSRLAGPWLDRLRKLTRDRGIPLRVAEPDPDRFELALRDDN